MPTGPRAAGRFRLWQRLCGRPVLPNGPVFRFFREERERFPLALCTMPSFCDKKRTLFSPISLACSAGKRYTYKAELC